MFKKNNVLSHFLIITFVFLCANCSASENYLHGLNSYKQGNISTSIKYFENSLKSNNSIEQYLALKKLCSMDSISSQQRLKYSKIVLKSKNVADFEVYNLYVQSLLDCNQFSKCISEVDKYLAFTDLTRDQKIWLEYCKAVSLVKQSFRKNNVYDFDDKFVRYFLTDEFSSEYHVQFFAEFENQDYKLKDLLEFRKSVYQKEYSKAKKLYDSSVKEFINLKKAGCGLLSDFGKFALTGNAGSYSDLATLFALTYESKNVKDKESYFCAYYSGRLYEKNGSFETAKKYYLNASSIAYNDSSYDDALWYYLKLVKKDGEETFISALKKYGPTFKNKRVYSDIIEELFVAQLSSKRWKSFANLYEIVTDYASPGMNAYYDYVLARLLQEGFVSKEIVKVNETELFTKVVENPSSSTYYIVLSAEQLGFTPEEAVSRIFSTQVFVSENERLTKDAIALMKDCLKEKNIKELFSIYTKYKKYISSEDCAYFARKVNKIAEKDETLYPYVLRLASSATFSPGNGKDLELLKLYFPQFYKKQIHSVCKKYSIDEDLLFGLVHSESFFNKDVVSRTGAVGLCQLMGPTASDIAKKLKLKDYDLTNPEVNVEFGAFYLAEMVRRLDGSVMDAIVSYNSGITRVRNWHKTYTDVPIDIFIEMLPYEESREYGKKVLSAAVVYGYLYYGKTTKDVIEALLN